jgi:hypothetical protein
VVTRIETKLYLSEKERRIEIKRKKNYINPGKFSSTRPSNKLRREKEKERKLTVTQKKKASSNAF